MTAKFILRNLPGMAEIAALQAIADAHPNPLWAPEAEQVKTLAAETSRRVFGISEEDTFGDNNVDGDLPEPEWIDAATRWNERFDFLYEGEDDDQPDDQLDANEVAIWEVLGWDITDGGKALHPAYFKLCRQMLCATKGWRGRLPGGPISDQEATTEAERWARSLTGKDAPE